MTFTPSATSTGMEIPYGFCKCGCGQKTNVAPQRRFSCGRWMVKGEHYDFVLGHNGVKTSKDATEKACSRCGKVKVVAEYYGMERTRDGLRPDCKKCVRAQQEATKRADPDHLEKRRAYYAATIEKRRAEARRNYERHREERIEKSRQWAKANPEKVRRNQLMTTKRYQTRKLGAYVEDVDPDAVLLRDLGLCGICGEPVMEAAFHIDHVHPLSKGGKHAMDNVQLAHAVCNFSKGAKVLAVQ